MGGTPVICFEFNTLGEGRTYVMQGCTSCSRQHFEWTSVPSIYQGIQRENAILDRSGVYVQCSCSVQPVYSRLHGQCTLQLHCIACPYTAGTLHFGLGYHIICCLLQEVQPCTLRRLWSPQWTSTLVQEVKHLTSKRKQTELLYKFIH